MIVKVFHLTGAVKYLGYVSRTKLPKELCRFMLNPNYKLYDIHGLFLYLFNGSFVREFDEYGDLLDNGIVENGQFKRNKKMIDNTSSNVSLERQDSIIHIPSSSIDNFQAIFSNPPFQLDLEPFTGYYPPEERENVVNDNSSIVSDDSSFDSDDSSFLVSDDSEDNDLDWKTVYENSYEGEVYNGLPNGKGILYDLYETPPVYVGNFLNGNFHRKGIYYMKGEKIYNGEWKDGKRDGFGKYFWNNQLYFEGVWKKDFPHFGKIYSDEGNVIFNGFFKDFNGVFCFYENLHLETVYVGNWKYGKKDGFGIVKKFNTVQYEGFWKEGRMNGEGKLYKNGHLHFDGNFKNNEKHGYGVLYSSCGKVIYEGEWKKDKKDGYGKEDSGWDIYKGQWKNDMRHGYGIEWTENSTEDGFYKIYSGRWENNEKYGEGIDYYDNGNIQYEGDFKECEEGFGRDYYENGKLKYEGEWKRGFYCGKGSLFYMDGSLCFEGQFLKGGFYYGTFYDKDGSVHKSSFDNGDYYCYGITLSLDNDVVFYRGNFKNGLPSGKGTSYRDENEPYYVGEYKDGKFHGKGTYYRLDGKEVSGKFLNGFFVNENQQCLQLVYPYETEDVIVYKGSIQNEAYFTGIEYLFEKDDEDGRVYYHVEPIGSVVWKDGKIFDEHAERLRVKKELNILNYLETKNKKKLEKIYKKDYIHFLKEKYSIDEKMVEKKTKKQLLRDIEIKRKEVLSTKQVEETEYDLFGNEIVNPVIGFDNEKYDESSMKYLFERNDENEFVHIQYTYDENDNRIPNYPIMANGKKLDGYTRGKIKVYEYPLSRVESSEESFQMYQVVCHVHPSSSI